MAKVKYKITEDNERTEEADSSTTGAGVPGTGDDGPFTRSSESSKQITILPVGEITKGTLAVAAKAVTSTFDCEIQLAQRQLPPQRESEYERFNAHDILQMAEEVDSRGKTLAVTAVGIRNGASNSIFSRYRPNGSVSVISVYRFYAPDPDTFYERVRKEAVRTVAGMVVGIQEKECQTPRCVMQHSRDIGDLDDNTEKFCVECQEKLEPWMA